MLFRFGLVVFISSIFFVSSSQAGQVVGDYHVSIYKDVQGSAEALEAFTKNPEKKVFFGVSCSMQSPFPLIQLIAFDDSVISETPKYLTAHFKVDELALPQQLNGILAVVDNVDEFSNKVRFEVALARGSSMQTMQTGYMQLLEQLRQGKALTVELEHRTLGVKSYEFSLQGLNKALDGNENLCR